MSRAVLVDPNPLIDVKGAGEGDHRSSGESDTNLSDSAFVTEAEVEVERILTSLAGPPFIVKKEVAMEPIGVDEEVRNTVSM